MRITYKLSGFEDLGKTLRELPVKVENRVLQTSTNRAMRSVKDVVVAAAPENKGEISPSSATYGSLKSNIKVVSLRKARRKGQRGSRITTGDAFWGFIYEMGSRHQPARPWFLPAFKAQKTVLIETLAKELGAGIIREARKK